MLIIVALLTADTSDLTQDLLLGDFVNFFGFLRIVFTLTALSSVTDRNGLTRGLVARETAWQLRFAVYRLLERTFQMFQSHRLVAILGPSRRKVHRSCHFGRMLFFSH